MNDAGLRRNRSKEKKGRTRTDIWSATITKDTRLPRARAHFAIVDGDDGRVTDVRETDR